jgi:transaldolase
MTERGLRTLENLMFKTAPQDLANELASWRAELRAQYAGAASDELRNSAAELLAENAIDLQSVLTEWNLKSKSRHGDVALTEEQLVAESEASIGILEQWGRVEVANRVKREVGSIASSNLAQLTRMAMSGEVNTFWGNDYAAHLRNAMRRGAAMVTTNPVLVNIARTEDPAYWTPVRDALKEAFPSYDPVQLGYAMTIAVVVNNAKLLRPIWELTNWAMGYVSLQLSPKEAKNADAMIEGARWVWQQLEVGLGGTPNCVFKVPGTKAGITVAETLTSEAMGINVTVNFALPQQIAFAGAIENNSTTKVCYRTQMDGRLDDPVGDELKAAGVSDWEEVKTWCTTAIRQREYRMLCLPPEQGGLGLKKSIPLPASGRGVWNIERSIIDGTHPVPIFLTIFPDKAELFDSEPREIDPNGMWAELPAGHLEKLYKSKLFRQAYEPDGMTVDEFDDYLPVVATLTGFAEGYDEFIAWVAG